jgi:RimJ/RimL family protein N-acetyltransferase
MCVRHDEAILSPGPAAWTSCDPAKSLRPSLPIEHHSLVVPRQLWAVRPATADDLDRLFELVDAVVREDKWLGAQPPLDRTTSIERWRSELDDPYAVRFVVEEDGRLVGEVSAHLNGGRADLGMQVAEDYRGLGVGTALLNTITDWARANNAHKATLQVWPHNQQARNLYEQFGFFEEGRLRRHYRRKSGELWDAIVMGLVFDDTSPGSRFANED